MGRMVRETAIHLLLLLPLMIGILSATVLPDFVFRSLGAVALTTSSFALLVFRLRMRKAVLHAEGLEERHARAIRRIRMLEREHAEPRIPVPAAANAGASAESRVRAEVVPPPISDPIPASSPANPRPDPSPEPASPRPEDFEKLFATRIDGVGHRIAALLAASSPRDLLEPTAARIVRPVDGLTVARRIRFDLAGGRETGVREWMYLPVAERLGHAVATDRIRLDLLDETCASWRTIDPGAAPIVDVCGASLADPSFTGHIVHRFAADAKSGAGIVLAIAQKDLKRFEAAQRGNCLRLRAAGIRFALRDVDDLRVDARALAAAGFRYVLFPTPASLSSYPGARADLRDLLLGMARTGILAVAENVAEEGEALLLQSFGTGLLSGPAADLIADKAASRRRDAALSDRPSPPPGERARDKEEAIASVMPLRRPA